MRISALGGGICRVGFRAGKGEEGRGMGRWYDVLLSLLRRWIIMRLRGLLLIRKLPPNPHWQEVRPPTAHHHSTSAQSQQTTKPSRIRDLLNQQHPTTTFSPSPPRTLPTPNPPLPPPKTKTQTTKTTSSPVAAPASSPPRAPSSPDPSGTFKTNY